MDDSIKYAGADCMLGSDDVAKLLGCTKDDARALMKKDIIPSVRFGKHYKTRKFAFNDALVKLDGKDVRTLIG